MQTELREKLARMYDVKDDKQVFVFGLTTQVSLRGSLPGPRHAPGHPPHHAAQRGRPVAHDADVARPAPRSSVAASRPASA